MNLRDNVLVRGVCNREEELLSLNERPAQAPATAVQDATQTAQTKVRFELRQKLHFSYVQCYVEWLFVGSKRAHELMSKYFKGLFRVRVLRAAHLV